MNEPTTANDTTFLARGALQRLYEDSPLPIADRMFNLGLYTRSSLLVKFLVMDDLYRRVLNIPGALVEFGIWYGQNLVLLENLRAIHEPFNKGRKIIGFDSFEGYDSTGVYRAGPEYRETLEELLRTHEGCNAFGHLTGNHEIVTGDVRATAMPYFVKMKQPVALAIFDMGPYEETCTALNAIRPWLMPGSVLLFDEFTTSGEADALRAVGGDYRIEKCALYPSKAIVTVC